MTPDFINGCIEFCGGCLLWLSVRTLYKHKVVRGISIIPIVFFTGWGFWNLLFYPSVGCMWSFYGGINIVVANTTWLILMFTYRRNK